MLEHLTAKDIPGRYKELVDNIGIEGFKYLVQMHGGTLFYVVNYALELRNRGKDQSTIDSSSTDEAHTNVVYLY